MLPWGVKYQPKGAADIPQADAVRKLRLFLESFPQKKRAAFLHGPSGTGKTAAVHVLAREFGHEVVEVNASDARNTEQIESRIGQAAKQRSLFHTSKVILVDEVDGISGQQDRGGVAALAGIIKTSPYPVVLTANSPWDQKFSSLRKLALMIEFPPVHATDVFNILAGIAKEEKVAFDDIALKSLSRRCGGDIRGAIIDLQVLAPNITREIVDRLDERDKNEAMQQALTRILKQTDHVIALTALEHVEEDIDEAFLWIEENMPKEYTKPADLRRAFEVLSTADVFRGRIRRWQHWRFLAYVNDLLTAGIASAKEQPYRAVVQYGPTQRILKLWIAKQKYALRNGIAEKIAQQCHCSKRRALQDILPYARIITGKYPVQEFFELDEEEAAWISTG